jgi:hypothetical protein
MMGQTLPIEKFSKYPQAEIANKHVTMNLLLPDPEQGSYRATRFDWSGIISSLKYGDHEYYGYWKSTHDPLIHEDLSGPVESSNEPGMGFEEAEAGGRFIRLGVGVIEKPDNKPFEIFKTYKIVDNGNWEVKKGDDWIEFKHIINSDIGYGYIYTKRIALKSDEPGFRITHVLENTGKETIETDQYNHNFFIIDGERSGPAIQIEFPYAISTDNDLKGLMEINGNELKFIRELTAGNSIWMELNGYGNSISDHNVIVKNLRSGAGVKFNVDKPLYKMVFWACHTTYCPENFIYIVVKPGVTETWVSDYILFTE